MGLSKMNDSDSNESPEETREWFRKEIATNGLRTAYAALQTVCSDPKAPAPAKATAGVALMRAAGVFADLLEPEQKSLAEMTAEELATEIKRLRRRSSQQPKPAGVFE